MLRAFLVCAALCAGLSTMSGCMRSEGSSSADVGSETGPVDAGLVKLSARHNQLLMEFAGQSADRSRPSRYVVAAENGRSLSLEIRAHGNTQADRYTLSFITDDQIAMVGSGPNGTPSFRLKRGQL